MNIKNSFANDIVANFASSRYREKLFDAMTTVVAKTKIPALKLAVNSVANEIEAMLKDVVVNNVDVYFEQLKIESAPSETLHVSNDKDEFTENDIRQEIKELIIQLKDENMDTASRAKILPLLLKVVDEAGGDVINVQTINYASSFPHAHLSVVKQQLSDAADKCAAFLTGSKSVDHAHGSLYDAP